MSVSLCLFKKNFIGVLVSTVQQSKSVIHTFICIYVYIYICSFLDSFPIRSLQSIEKSSLCYTGGPY